MSKELFVSSSPHETKVAVFEDDNLVEVFYQRDTDVGLVGGIYKGRVSRVLPGMQSAFVDVGLERDAFLYVSDFFEDSDEYDRVVAEAETRVSKYTATESGASARSEQVPAVAPPSLPAPPVEKSAEPVAEPVAAPEASWAANGGALTSPSQPAAAPGAVVDTHQWSKWQESRGRGRRRRRGRGIGGKPEFREHRPPEAAPPAENLGFLPGESLAKYAHLGAESGIAPDGGKHLEVASSETPEAEKALETLSGRPASIEPELGTRTGQPEMPSWAPGSSEPRPERSPEASDGRVEPVEPGDPGKPGGIDPQSWLPAPEGGATAFEAFEGVSMRAGEETHGGSAEAAPAAPRAPVSNDGSHPDALRRAQAGGAGGAVQDAEPSAGLEEGGATAESLRVEEEETAPEGAADLSEGGRTADSNESGAPAFPGGRTYTLRDSQQRPRFAPRHGRRGRGGRPGRQGSRPEGPPPEGLRPEGSRTPGAPATTGPQRQDHPRGGNEQAVQIGEVLKEGQEILVQIAKEPLGSKGARITSHVALPGRYLVYMPTIQHTGVSRKIASEEERLRLRTIILEHRGSLTGGIIVRTAAAGRSEDELKADVGFLAKLWDEIRSKSERSKAPALIHRDLTLVERILRDILSPDFKSVRVDNELEYQNVLDFVHRFQPSLVGHVKLYTKETPMFEEFGIQTEIDKALKPKVWLKSGGYIVINQTEALVAIDVNTGKYVGKTNRLEDTIVKTNVDAVKEIVRQVRLRDLGGIIVIDFIDMDDRRNRLKVVQALEEALRTDRAPTKIVAFNEFGLVALTRKRVKQSLERTLSEPCPYCTGSGWIKSVTTVCYEILEEARKMAQEMDGKVLTLRVHPEVARALKSREGALASELESSTGKDVVIQGDASVHHERFEIF